MLRKGHWLFPIAIAGGGEREVESLVGLIEALHIENERETGDMVAAAFQHGSYTKVRPDGWSRNFHQIISCNTVVNKTAQNSRHYLYSYQCQHSRCKGTTPHAGA